MSFSPEYFGRYLLLESLGQAWNTELFNAKLFGVDGGPDRVVTIKKVVAEISGEELQRSFEQEIKITVSLNHPNIVQTYDFGLVDERYFMAMEYLPGQNLGSLLRRLSEQDLMCSAELSCFIVSQVCHALSYAHGFRDRISGEKCAVVHRDVTPEKIMLSYEGAVKLVDFGMARMETPDHFTRVGVIAGQPGYMSPERLFGDDLDGRADVYSLGVVLWEMLTGRAFRAAGGTLAEVRERLREPVEPPSQHNNAVPKRLDKIVMRAIAVKPDDRYASAADFQRDLHHFLYAHAPDFNPQDLTACLQELFRPEVDAEEKKLREFLSTRAPVKVTEAKEVTIAAVDYAQVGTRTSIERTGMLISDTAYTARELEKLFVKNAQNHRDALIEAPAESGPVEMEGVPAGLMTAKSMIDVLPVPVIPEAAEAKPEERALPTARANALPAWSWAAAGGALGCAVLVGMGFYFYPDLARRWRGEGSGQAAATPPAPGRAIASVSPAPVAAPSSPNATVAPSDSAPAPDTALTDGDGTILFEGDTFGFDLEINGRFTPVVNNRITWPAGIPFRLRARKAGAEDFVYEGRVTGGVPLKVALQFPPRRPKGILSIITATEMKVKILDGEKLVYEGRAPVSDVELPAGAYRLVLENSFLGEATESAVEIDAGRKTVVHQ